MNDLRKYFSRCLLVTAALLGIAFPAFADQPSTATAAVISLLSPAQSDCNQGVGNGPEEYCDPGNSNQGDSTWDDPHSNDEFGGVPGSPGRKGGNK